MEGSDEVRDYLGLMDPSRLPYVDIDWMKRNINRCIKHTHKPAYDGYLPERLLDVSGECPVLVLRDGSEANKIRPVLPEKSPTSPRSWRALLGGARSIDDPVPEYCALSYCWGSPEQARTQLTTTSESLSNRLAGISEDEIPPVLKDAITITRALGVPYLWIDALCILQGDTDDWDRQCAQMDKIYGSALVTLFAGSSNSCQEGFLQPRGGSVHIPFESTLYPGISGCFSLRFQKAAPHLHPNLIPRVSEIYNDVSLCRLRSRGWTFQEDHMSTRRIFFGNTYTHFSCGSFQEDLEGITGRADIYNKWENIAGLYRSTRDDFTFAEDALPALTGIASVFGNMLGDEYLAGHWRGDFFQSLLWMLSWTSKSPRDEHFRLLEHRSPYVVPSWSCVSKGTIQNVVRHNSQHVDFKPEGELTNFQLPPAGSNRFGRILGGRLVITSRTLILQQCNLLEVNEVPVSLCTRCSNLFREKHWVFHFQDGRRLLLDLDFPTTKKEGCDTIRESTLVLLGSTRHSSFSGKSSYEGSTEGDSDASPDGTEAGEDSIQCTDKSTRYPVGLVLRPSFLNPGVFHRIGIFFPMDTMMFENTDRTRPTTLQDFTEMSQQQCINLE